MGTGPPLVKAANWLNHLEYEWDSPVWKHWIDEVFTTLFIPDAGPEQMEWFNELQQVSASPENAARLWAEFSRVDVRARLADIHVPTIVAHCEGDGVVPFDEGRRFGRTSMERGWFRCRAATIFCSRTSRPGRSSCESSATFSGGSGR